MLSRHPNCPGETETQRNGSRTTAVKITERTTLKIASPRNLLDSSIACMFRTPRQNHSEEGLVPSTAVTLPCQIIKALPHHLRRAPLEADQGVGRPDNSALRLRVLSIVQAPAKSMPINTRPTSP